VNKLITTCGGAYISAGVRHDTTKPALWWMSNCCLGTKGATG